MYRCIVRYGYKDVPGGEDNFEDNLVLSVAEFIQMESGSSLDSTSTLDGRMAVIRTGAGGSRFIILPENGENSSAGFSSRKSETLRSLQESYEREAASLHGRRRVTFALPEVPEEDPLVREELEALAEAKKAGVAYVMGHSYIKARRNSSFVKKFAINVAYSFLRKNCRGPAVALNIPHVSLIEVGMVYYV